jgi:CRISPR-associated protein Csm5
MNIEVVDFEISVLSPLHVGCDEQVEPTSALFHDGVLWDGIDFYSAVTTASMREELKAITHQFSNERFSSFKNKYREQLLPWAERATPVAKEMQKIFEEKMSALPARRTSFDSLTHAPMIPGSSLKGALRGLLLGGVKGQRFQESNWRFSSDPMSMISVADLFPLNPASAKTCFAGKERLYKRDARLVRNLNEAQMGFCEVVLPAPEVFSGRLMLKSPHAERALADKAFTKETFFSTCRRQTQNFLSQRTRNNKMFWESSDLDILWPNAGLGESFGNLFHEILQDSSSLLLRLGSASGAEHTSLDWMRAQWNGEDDGKPPHTWTVAKFASNKRIPMGWVVITDLKKKNKSTQAWQQELSKMAAKLHGECPDQPLEILERYQSKREAFAKEQQLMRAAELRARAESQERERIEREKQAAQEAQRASFSEFLRNFDSLCEKIEKSAQPIQINNNLWQSVVKFSNEFASQSAEDKFKSTEWFTQRIEPKLALPKDKLKELKRKLS